MSRIRANTITNKAATGAPTFSNGAVVTGVCTATSFVGSGASLTGISAGITMADQWNITTDNNKTNGQVIDSNWERSDYFFAQIGSGMSESSGIFTFPSTGIWRVEAVFAFYAATSTDGNMYGYIQSTQNNSSYIDQVELHMFAAANDHGSDISGYFIFDVTDTSTHKVRFTQKNFSNANDMSYGNTDRNMTYFTFTRLGDT